MIRSFKTRIAALREQGFTLTEIAVALIVFGVLAAIALPLYLNAVRSVSSLDVTTGLVQAATQLDAEKNDNNGLYPVYMPNEILGNSLWKTFAYTYSDDRLTFCLQGSDSNGNKFFVSSTAREPSSTNCGQANVAKNSATPWNLSSYPNIDISTYTINWAANASTPTGSVSWTNGACTDGTTTYQLKLQNLTQGTTTFYPTTSQIQASNSGLTGYSLAPDLSGWLPSDVTTVSAAAVCTESTGGRLYTFIGPYTGATKTVNVPQFPVVATSYVSAPQASFNANADNSLTMQVAAQFATITCPTLTGGISGTNHPVYQLVAHQDGQTDVGTNTFSTNPNITLTLANFTPDTSYNTYTGRSYCEFTRTTGTTSRYSGTDTNDTSKDGHAQTGEWAPVGFPTAPGTPTTVSNNGGSIKPDGLTWTAPGTRACTYGGSLQYSYQQLSPGSSSSPYSAGLSSGLINWSQGTSYKYIVNAKCVGTHGASNAVASAPVQFTTGVNAPDASFSNYYSSSYSSGQLLANGNVNSANCPAGQTLYRISASQNGENDVVSLSGSTNPTLTLNGTNSPNYGYDGDKLVTYKAQIICRVTQYDGSTADWGGNTASTNENAAVANPNGTNAPGTYTSGDPDVIPNGLSWGGQSCPNGGSIQYKYVQTYPGYYESDWFSGTNAQDLGWNPGTTYNYRIHFRCLGYTRISDTVVGSTISFGTQYNTPHAPGAPGGIWTDQYGYSGVTTPNRVLWYSVGCDRGGNAQYLLREVRVGGNYNGNGYNQTDWMTNTTVFSVPDSWLRQGSQIGYQVIARCYNNAGISNNSNWSGERNDITGIGTPGATGLNRSGDRYTSWGGVGCGQGAYAQYLWQQYNHNQGQTAYGNAFDNGWGQYYAANVDGYNGYSQGVRVYTRCVGDNAVSGNAESNHIDYQIPVYAPRLQLICRPGLTTDYSGNGTAGSNCDNNTLGFAITCGSAAYNPSWNGSSQPGNGITLTSAPGLAASQLDSNNGDRYARHTTTKKSGTSGYTTSYGTWGQWAGYINGSYCVAGNGAASGRLGSFSVRYDTGGGTTYN